MKYSLFLLLICSLTSFGQQMDCEELIKYRDSDLVSIYDKTIKSYLINENALKDIQQYRKELEDDNVWAASDGVALVVTIKLLCDAFNDIMAVGSPQGKVINLAKEFHGKTILPSSIRVLNGINKGKDGLSLMMTENIEYEIFKLSLTELGRVGNAASFFLNLRDNIETLNDHQNLKKEVNNQLTLFDKAISEYDIKVNQTFKEVDLLNKYKAYIDEYLTKNCKTPSCQWIDNLEREIKKGTRCGKNTSVEVNVTNNFSYNLRTFASFQNSNGTWSKWKYDGTFGSGIKPEEIKNWYVCNGSGKVKILAVRPSKEKCKLPDPNKF
ncbi:hypothetical protein [uncultured Olleya sp.]|uniref:hypothetical protein n=1 Tax=uncultured Olleya sp. TaxID=757243 RepID=UPI002595A9D1|nr:hypothetical protein [uncultured Olleya sp.]